MSNELFKYEFAGTVANQILIQRVITINGMPKNNKDLEQRGTY